MLQFTTIFCPRIGYNQCHIILEGFIFHQKFEYIFFHLNPEILAKLFNLNLILNSNRNFNTSA